MPHTIWSHQTLFGKRRSYRPSFKTYGHCCKLFTLVSLNYGQKIKYFNNEKISLCMVLTVFSWTNLVFVP